MNNEDLPSAVDDAATATAESAANELHDNDTVDHEEQLKRKIELLRKRDPFVYR